MDENTKNLYLAANKFLEFFYNSLKESKICELYLKKRNLVPDIIERFKIGHCIKLHDKILNFIESEKIDYDVAKKLGIIKYDDDNKILFPFANRLMFPIFNPYNECIGFSGRTLKIDIKPKYINSPTSLIYQKRRVLYGLNFCKEELYKNKYVFVVEGNLDVVKCHQNNLTNVVCPMGTSFTEEQCKILKRYVDAIIIIFDGDDAGRKAAKDAKIIIKNNNINCIIFKLPDGYDPDSFIDKYSIDKLNYYINKRKM